MPGVELHVLERASGGAQQPPATLVTEDGGVDPGKRGNEHGCLRPAARELIGPEEGDLVRRRRLRYAVHLAGVLDDEGVGQVQRTPDHRLRRGGDAGVDDLEGADLAAALPIAEALTEDVKRLTVSNGERVGEKRAPIDAAEPADAQVVVRDAGGKLGRRDVQNANVPLLVTEEPLARDPEASRADPSAVAQELRPRDVDRRRLRLGGHRRWKVKLETLARTATCAGRPPRNGLQDEVATRDVRAPVRSKDAPVEDPRLPARSEGEERRPGNVFPVVHLAEERQGGAALLVVEEPDSKTRPGCQAGGDRTSAELEHEVPLRLVGVTEIGDAAATQPAKRLGQHDLLHRAGGEAPRAGTGASRVDQDRDASGHVGELLQARQVPPLHGLAGDEDGELESRHSGDNTAAPRPDESRIRPSATPEPGLVSVVVPVFDGEAFLRDSLESILAQSYERLELIVMDDASADASPTIAAELARRDVRVRVQRQSSNLGQFANVNAGLALARGEFVAVYHADDVYDRDIVEREVAYLRSRPEAGAVFALATFIDQTGREFGRIELVPPEVESRDLLDYPLVLNAILRHTSSFLPTPSALVRHDVYAEVGPYAVDYGIRGDIDMWLRIARARPVGLLREHLLRYRVGTHNESRRYSFLRTEPDVFYSVVDRVLDGPDGVLATPDAIADYEARRAADLLVAAGNAYVLDERPQLHALLRCVRAARLLRSRRVQRWRLLALLGLLHGLARLPRSDAVARFLEQRWHSEPTVG